MERQTILEHLALAEKHVLTGATSIAAQMAAIAQLKRDGHDAVFAENVLQTFRELQSTFVGDRDRLLKLTAGR